MEPPAYAGLVQESPLSPMIFAIFNANLDEQPVNIYGGTLTFIGLLSMASRNAPPRKTYPDTIRRHPSN
jgi:hypothetical protein